MRSTEDGRADPLGRAMYDYQRGDPGTLTYRDGAAVRDGHVEEYYFQPPSEWADATVSLLERLAAADGPVLDVGCGAGQHTLWWQERGVDVVGVDVSPWAVAAARERGVEAVSVADMFTLPFDRDAFGGLYAGGTQLGLAGSLTGIGDLLAEFARVTDGEAVAVVDNYDPTDLEESFFGYRPDPREGVAHRCFHFEYEFETDEGERTRAVGKSLHFLLCSSDRLREAAIATPWTVRDVVGGDGHYRAVLTKSNERTGR